LPAVHAGAGLTVVVACTWRARRRGLAGLAAPAPGHALLLRPCRSVHTVGMRFALDLLWLDAGGALVRVDRDVGPRRLCGCRRARAVLECAAGEGERFAQALSGAASSLVSASEGMGRRRWEPTRPMET
jgi:uncharacterized membrane protein (UPF0127 family)